MTKDEYELMTFFNKPVKELAKPVHQEKVYIGSGEDFDLELSKVYQLENPEHGETRNFY